MEILFILLVVILISCFSFFGSLYARKYQKPDALIGLYISFVLISNIVAYKIASFDLGFVTLYATSGVLVFSITFLLTDIVNEKFGRKETHKMIFIAFLTQVLVAFVIWISISLDAAPFWSGQSAFNEVLGFAPRIMLASWVAFLISENTDAYLFSWFKRLTSGKHLWMRNAFSSLPSMALDSIIFTTIAFLGVQPILPLIFGILIIKWIIGLVNIPFMYINRNLLFKA
ncbi:queuosine precursor transporter [archaeon]|jgi:queuosine precursor transporter|nr:queuosine precursor transporter [archaeon]MBT4373115.1 queuosine precursor transporter [archaeon]MBT4531460.1 queuosine precursor transporter [archaeon]MBT7001362.1 queuosine precursor transporter [archaeon]MBT7282152.1 queuosine precursor transporter [archaeon]